MTLACGALPADAIEAALFGLDRSMDASERKPGKFAEAHGGALFLDDVGALPLQRKRNCCARCSRARSNLRGAAVRSGPISA